MQMLARAQSSSVKKGFIFERKNLILSSIFTTTIYVFVYTMEYCEKN